MGGIDLFDATASPAPDGAWSVVAITRRARKLIESGLARVWVRGEVTGLRRYRSGHWYFSLRDPEAQVRCVMWRSDNQALRTAPDDGTEVFVEAQPTVWEEKGEFRLTVRRMLPTAEGGWWQVQLEKARAALERDGLLDPARKRALPAYPNRIAVVTSTDGAALRDILAVAERRWPQVELWVVPTRVQGEAAEGELCAALGLANRLPDIDLVIVGRGGGSREDLWAFNSERVARAVAGLRVPSVSAVGHETDVTLTDLVADVRAPTPSAAAETVLPDGDVVRRRLQDASARLARGLQGRVALAGERMERTADRLTAAMQQQIDRRRTRVGQLGAQLEALSPLRVLARGYSVARDKAGRVLRRTADFPSGLRFRLTVSDGDVEARAGEGTP